MRPETWISDLFSNRSRVEVLRLLARDPHRVWTEREMAKALGLSPNSANLAARSLRDQGIIDFQKVGRSHAIRLRSDLSIAKRIEQVFYIEGQLWQEYRDAIMRVVPIGTACCLFGSTARGSPSPSSDVDIMVVANTKHEADDVASKVRSAAASVIPTSLEIISFDRVSFRKRKKSPLVQNVLREGIPLSLTALEEFL